MRRSRLRIGVILGAAWLGFFAAVTAYAQPSFEPGLARAIEVQERHTSALMSTPGVVGTAVGHDANGQPAVIVMIDMREVRGLPSTLDGYRVVIRRTGQIRALPRCAQPPCNNGGGTDTSPDFSRTDAWPRPVPIGVSTGHPNITAGTIGARVKGGPTEYFALSNNHVYANENKAAINDDVLQPGPFDGGDPNNANHFLGKLAAYVPIHMDCVCSLVCLFCTPNQVDAAIASTTTSLLGNSTPSDGYGVPKSQTVPARLDMRVQKYGRTTGQTSGRITAINATVNVGYSNGVAQFVGQIIIEPGSFSAGGDSGSLIVGEGKGRDKSDDGKPVGLLFAGSSFVTVANPIDTVLGSFGAPLTIDGQ